MGVVAVIGVDDAQHLRAMVSALGMIAALSWKVRSVEDDVILGEVDGDAAGRGGWCACVSLG